MLKLNEVKEIVKSCNSVHRYSLPNERQTRRAISELALDGVLYIPFEKNIYKRVNEVSSLSKHEQVKLNEYLSTELKSAIKLIRRVRKLEKFMSSEQKKLLHGELV